METHVEEQIDVTEMKKSILASKKSPAGLKELLRDKQFLALYEPASAELEVLLNTFGPMGDGTKASYFHALMLVRSVGTRQRGQGLFSI